MVLFCDLFESGFFQEFRKSSIMRSLIILAILQAVLGASIVPCPETCHCNYSEESLDVKCENFEFLNKLISKQYTSITKLQINATQSIEVNPKLKYLKNLETLNLSHNSIYLMHLSTLKSLKQLNLKDTSLKDVHFRDLPKNLEHLDLSNNYLSKIPRDWTNLKSLKSLDLSNNPINCDCQNSLTYKDMLKQGIEFISGISCGNKDFSGKNLDSINCTPLDLMLNDEVPIINEELDESHDGVQNDQMEGSGFGVFDDKIDAPLEEGSGFDAPQIIEPEEPENDETGSGFGLLPDLPDMPKACTENCTEHDGLIEEDGASPLPGIKEQFDIMNGDLFNIHHDTTQTPPETTTTAQVEVTEVLLTKQDSPFLEKEKQDQDNYNLTENTKLGRASIGQDTNNTVYIIIGATFVGLVCVVIFLVKRKYRISHNRRKQLPEENYGDELKPLEKKSMQPLNEKQAISPDHVPLMNGNGKVDDVEFKEVDLRPKPGNGDLLTPKRERVTIKETELPDSIPRTPLLVHREVSSDGKIVLTPVDQ